MSRALGTSAEPVHGKLAVDFDSRRIDAIFAEFNQCHLPGAAVGVAVGGQCIYRKGFGLAHMELGVALSPAMRMRIGSTTKHFASLAYLLLCEQRESSLDDTIGKYLPELNPVTRNVTMRQLMGHVSGLRDAYDISWLFSGTGCPVSSAELLSLYETIDDVDATPGRSWSYNNGGYLILSSVIERISGKSLEDVLRERLFVPTGMSDTMLRRWDTDFIPNSATLHTSVQPGLFHKLHLGTSFSGEGGIVSTVDDLLRWLLHMDAHTVGNARTWEMMRVPLRLANGTRTEYGLGLVVSDYRGVGTISHPGGVMGGNSQMLKVPSAGLDVVVMLNRSDGLAMSLVNKVLDACLPSLGPARKPVAGWKLISGVFRSLTTGRVIELQVKGDQQIVSLDGYDLPFEPIQPEALGPTPEWTFLKQTITLRRGRDGLTSLKLEDFGTVDDLVAVEPAATGRMGSIVGRYSSVSTRTRVEIHATDAGAELRTHGAFGSAHFHLQSLGHGLWKAKSQSPIPWGGILSFDEDCKVFHFSSPRTRALHFLRDATRQ